MGSERVCFLRLYYRFGLWTRSKSSEERPRCLKATSLKPTSSICWVTSPVMSVAQEHEVGGQEASLEEVEGKQMLGQYDRYVCARVRPV